MSEFLQETNFDEKPKKEDYPEFLEETMFAEHGTKVLITNPKADVYLDQAQKRRDKYPQWDA